MSDKKVSVIEALLAKAEALGTTPEEAEALTQKAEQLMVKYAIEQAVIDARRKEKGEASEKIVTETMNFSQKYGQAFVMNAHKVVNAMGNLRCYRYTGSNVFVIVGYESDVAQAKRLVTSLTLQAVSAMAAWWPKFENEPTHDWRYNIELHDWEKVTMPRKSRMSKGDVRVARRSFLDQFFSGAASRIKKEREVAEKAAATESAGTALVLRSRKQAVDEHVDLHVGKLRNATSNRKHNASAGNAGYKAGQNANVGSRGVGAGRMAVGA